MNQYFVNDWAADESPADLYKIHSGYRLFDDSSSDHLSETSDSDGVDRRPPLYSYNTLLANSAKSFVNGMQINVTKGLQADRAMVQRPGTLQKGLAENNESPEAIALKLKAAMTKDYCSICDKTGSRHYKQPNHFKAVKSWIEAASNSDPKLLYCQACNLALTGNDKARAHYLEDVHVRNENGFCPTCLRFMNAGDMEEHRQSSGHKKNELAANESLISNVQESDKNGDSTKPKESNGGGGGGGSSTSLRVEDFGIYNNHIDANNSPEEVDLSKSILKFETIVSYVLGQPKTDFASTQFSCLTMYIRNFKKEMTKPQVDMKSVFQWSARDYPSRSSTSSFTIDEFDIVNLMLRHESVQLCRCARNRGAAVSKHFRDFNSKLLIVMDECRLISELLKFIDKSEFKDESNSQVEYSGDCDDLKNVTRFFETKLVIEKIVQTLKCLTNNFVISVLPLNNAFYIYQMGSLMTYMESFSKTLQLLFQKKGDFNIDNIFKSDKAVMDGTNASNNFEHYKTIVYKELDDLLKIALQQSNVDCRELFSYFSQFIWKLLFILKRCKLVIEALMVLQQDDKSELDLQLGVFKRTSSKFLGNRQTYWTLVQVRSLIMIIRSFTSVIMKGFHNCEDSFEQTVFKYRETYRPKEPLIVNAVKLVSEFEMYKLILYREIEQLDVLVRCQRFIDLHVLTGYFKRFNDELVLTYEQLRRGATAVGYWANGDCDDDSSFLAACEASFSRITPHNL